MTGRQKAGWLRLYGSKLRVAHRCAMRDLGSSIHVMRLHLSCLLEG